MGYLWSCRCDENSTMQLTWASDTHLNLVNKSERFDFYSQIKSAGNEGVILSGDIAEFDSLFTVLSEMETELEQAVYFVLGNHDFYSDSIANVKAKLKQFLLNRPNLYYLPLSGPIKLNAKTVILGQDGWADGRYGDFKASTMTSLDSQKIVDLHRANITGRDSLLTKMQQLADGDAVKLKLNLSQVKSHYKKIIVVTHVPPFAQASCYHGLANDANSLPFFSCKAIGDILYDFAGNNPHQQVLVLCGHTHFAKDYSPLQNLTVRVAAAKSGFPKIADIIKVGDCNE